MKPIMRESVYIEPPESPELVITQTNATALIASNMQFLEVANLLTHDEHHRLTGWSPNAYYPLTDLEESIIRAAVNMIGDVAISRKWWDDTNTKPEGADIGKLDQYRKRPQYERIISKITNYIQGILTISAARGARMVMNKNLGRPQYFKVHTRFNRGDNYE